MRLMLSATLLSVAIGMGTAWAQAPAPSPMSQDQKKAISKSCTDQANAKGLHGKGAQEIQVRVQKGWRRGSIGPRTS